MSLGRLKPAATIYTQGVLLNAVTHSLSLGDQPLPAETRRTLPTMSFQNCVNSLERFFHLQPPHVPR